MPPVLIGPRLNRQVTCDSNPANDRSESSLTANPRDHYNLVGSSKRFTNPALYQFSLTAYASWDGGQSWTDTGPLPLPVGTVSGRTVEGVSDPTVTFDDLGNAYIMGLAFSETPSLALLGMVAYKSTDKGRTWSAPTIVHQGMGDDKQIIAGDMNPASPHHGNVYATWDGSGPNNNYGVLFARTTDNGASWKGVTVNGVDQPTGTQIIPSAVFSTISVDSQGRVYVVALGSSNNQSALVCVVSTDGGNTFGPVQVIAAPITVINGVPDGAFRAETIPASCVTAGDRIVVAWPDGRNAAQHEVYYVRSGPNGNWPNNPGSGTLLTSAQPSPGGQQDIMPQLASTPDGTVGCAFCEYGPKAPGGASLIDVYLLVSTNSGQSFDTRARVTDQAWNPAVDLPRDTSGEGFIGDYFGLAASDLGFFPFWTDTRTGIQEMFASRLSVYPTDMLLRDSSTDTGTVPSPGNHWEAPDLVVSYSPAPPNPWVSQPLIPGQDHYIFAKVSNLGQSNGRNVRLAVTVGNFPGLLGMPSSEFRYPQDWYQGDWNTAALQNNHKFLGETAPITVNAGASGQVLGPLTWAAADIPPHATWHPCLLAEVRCDNDDNAGGPEGGPLMVASTNACYPGSFFWADNNVCQRNVSYAAFSLAQLLEIELPFIVGNPWSDAQTVEVIIEKDRRLAKVPMHLALHHVDKGPHPRPELATTRATAGAVALAAGNGAEKPEEGQLHWHLPSLEQARPVVHERLVGAEPDALGWRLLHPRGSVAFAAKPGALHRGVLSFRVDRSDLGEDGTATVRILQRNDRRVITGNVLLHIQPADKG